MFYPARCKKITVDQSKVLKNRLFRYFWATRYSKTHAVLYNHGATTTPWYKWYPVSFLHIHPTLAIYFYTPRKDSLSLRVRIIRFLPVLYPYNCWRWGRTRVLCFHKKLTAWVASFQSHVHKQKEKGGGGGGDRTERKEECCMHFANVAFNQSRIPLECLHCCMPLSRPLPRTTHIK